jgi:hypothetical protein
MSMFIYGVLVAGLIALLLIGALVVLEAVENCRSGR